VREWKRQRQHCSERVECLWLNASVLQRATEIEAESREEEEEEEEEEVVVVVVVVEEEEEQEEEEEE
jgi:hypothetical protein